MGRIGSARTGAVAGVAFVVFAVIADFSAGSLPAVNDSAATISAYFQDHHRVLLVGVILNGVGSPCVLWAFASLALAMRRAGEGALAALAFATAATGVALGTAGDAMTGALTQIARTGDDRFVKSGYELAGFFTQKAFWLVAFVALAVAAAAWRAMPRWYAWMSSAACVLLALGGIGVKQNGFFAVGGPVQIVGFLALLVWVLATSYLLWREPETVEAHTPATAAV